MRTTATAGPVVRHEPRASAATAQDSLPRRYRLGVQLLAMAAFSLAFVGWLNESWLYWFESPIWLNRYTEYAVILAFGVWRVFSERNPYSRKRLMVLVAVVTGFWWLIPWLTPTFEPYVGYLWSQPVFPSLHTPGTLTFFLVLILVLLFGRRVICGWGCPCVGIRETVGFAFRDRTLRGKWVWRLRHVKWLFFVWYMGVMVATLFPPTGLTVSFVGLFLLVVALTYFGSFFFTPITGNRFYCRYLCPYGATFGVLNHAGFYGVDFDAERCIDCRRCEQVCDMGIPVCTQGRQAGRVTGLEECMGCGRCVVSCPTDALSFRDVRNWLRPGLKQNASHLLKAPPVPVAPRGALTYRDAIERGADWGEIDAPPTAEWIRAQAARCLDCGEPGCRAACPLSNRIPDWLQAAARGDFAGAGRIAHDTNPLPEICGRLCPQQRLCEGACARARLDGGAVTIGVVEGYVAERSRAERPPAPSGRRFAVVGAGPAGLACADRLAASGAEVTVHDQAPVIGGLMATGVPPFKLDKARLANRRRLLEGKGVRFALGQRVDNAGLQRLLARHDGVFVGVGAQHPREVALSGRGLTGVIEALDYLAAVNAAHRGEQVDAAGLELRGRRVVVLGGGDTAMDCARSAIRQGARSVTVVYRGAEAKLRASPTEVSAARDEGVGFLFHRQPVALEGAGAVCRVRFRQDGQSHDAVSCDSVILAFGLQAAAPGWLEAMGVDIDTSGRVRIDESGRTSLSGLYAGGDNTHGPDLVVTAVAAGQRAAVAMLADAGGRRLRDRAVA